MSYAQIEYIELGFRSLKDNHYFGSTRVVSKSIKVSAALCAGAIIAFCYLICLVV